MNLARHTFLYNPFGLGLSLSVASSYDGCGFE